MDFGISTYFFHRQRLSVDLLESLRKAGYLRIELFVVRPHLDFHNRSLQRSIGRWFQENTMAAPSLHLPFAEYPGTPDMRWISPLDSERRSREFAMDEIKRSLELAEFVSPEFLVMHPGIPGQTFNPVVFEYVYAAIAQIRAFSGVKVFIENIPNEISTLDRLREFKSAAQLPDIGVCYDIGHGQLRSGKGHIGSWKDINAVHLNDNHGETDEHLWPFEGGRNWPALIQELVQAKYDGSFIFEVAGSNDLSRGHEVRNRLSALWDEAQNSIEEFRLRYRLPGPDEREES